MLSPLKQEKIIKQKTVNSFPTDLGLCAELTPPHPHPHRHHHPGENYRTPRSPADPESQNPKDKPARIINLGEGGRRLGLAERPKGALCLPRYTPGPRHHPPLDYSRSGWSRPPHHVGN
jgi:hypothetical protein